MLVLGISRTSLACDSCAVAEEAANLDIKFANFRLDGGSHGAAGGTDTVLGTNGSPLLLFQDFDVL